MPAFDRQYLPEGRSSFRLPCFEIESRYLCVYGGEDTSGSESKIEREARQGGRVQLLVHPTELKYYAAFLAKAGAKRTCSRGHDLWATPTSSARTVLAWQEGQPKSAFFAKLSLHSQILGDRTLSRGVVARSVGLSNLIAHSRGSLPCGMGYFPEGLGIMPRGMADGGVLFRSIPDEVLAGRVVPAPLFALMGGSARHPPLLLRLVERGRCGVREFLEEVVLTRFAKLWVDLVFDSGLILEAHGQDLLLALSPDLMPVGGFYYRDFEGLAVDWALRSARGLTKLESMPLACEWFSTYETWGYPLYQLISMKLMTSLFDYLHLVLSELESALLEWQASGITVGERVSDGELTSIFSRELRRAIHEKFGMREAEQYDIRYRLCRFVKFLLRVRREVMRVYGGSMRA